MIGRFVPHPQRVDSRIWLPERCRLPRINCYPSAQGRVRRQLRLVALKNKYDPTNFFRINQEAMMRK
jgi:Berberine and berberine like